jgi:hypothetical protein
MAGVITDFAEGHGHWCMICIVMDAANGILYRLLRRGCCYLKLLLYVLNVITKVTN